MPHVPPSFRYYKHDHLFATNEYQVSATIVGGGTFSNVNLSHNVNFNVKSQIESIIIIF